MNKDKHDINQILNSIKSIINDKENITLRANSEHDDNIFELQVLDTETYNFSLENTISNLVKGYVNDWLHNNIERMLEDMVQKECNRLDIKQHIIDIMEKRIQEMIYKNLPTEIQKDVKPNY